MVQKGAFWNWLNVRKTKPGQSVEKEKGIETRV
jgi:hypothetical protein